MDHLKVLDPDRLAGILAPFAEPDAGLAVRLENRRGALLAGTPGVAADPVVVCDIHFDGDVVGRLVTSGPASNHPEARASMDALARAIETWLADATARHAAEAALVSASTAADTRARRLDDELVLGRRLQRSFVAIVPPEVPGYDLASHYEAATEVGGDFFDLFRLRRRGHPLSVVVADVTGKGVAAALLMAFARPLLHAAVDHATGPADALERTNRVLVEERRSPLFITALCATMVVPTGRLRLANAGHEPPLFIPGDGSPVRSIEVGGPLLGAFGSLGLLEAELELRPGDVVLFYTDGVTDARAASGERFEEDRLLGAIEAARMDPGTGTAAGIVEAIRAAIGVFQAGMAPADDVTIVAIGRRSKGARRSVAAASARSRETEIDLRGPRIRPA